MKQFLVLYCMPSGAMAEMMKNSSPEEHKKGMEEWKVWQEAHKANIPVLGNPAGKNTRVTKESAEETPNEIGGYSIMQGESKDEVVKILQDGPHMDMPGAYMEAMELIEM